MKGEMCMNTIQVRIDFDTKLQLMRDAEANNLSLSTLMRRLISLYLTDESVRQKVQWKEETLWMVSIVYNSKVEFEIVGTIIVFLYFYLCKL